MKSSKNGKSIANIILKHFTKFEEIIMIAESTVCKNITLLPVNLTTSGFLFCAVFPAIRALMVVLHDFSAFLTIFRSCLVLFLTTSGLWLFTSGEQNLIEFFRHLACTSRLASTSRYCPSYGVLCQTDHPTDEYNKEKRATSN